MGRIFYIIGKSSTGKDSLLARLLPDEALGLREIVQYTTRPIRDGEAEGREYHFITPDDADAFEKAGRIIEKRVYQTVHGPWQYMMVDDGQIDLSRHDYAAVGTIEAYVQLKKYFGEAAVVPIYIYVETGERLQRALNRERTHDRPKYAEMCRRFLTDEADFDDAHLSAAGLLQEDGTPRNAFENVDFENCLNTVKGFIRKCQETR